MNFSLSPPLRAAVLVTCFLVAGLAGGLLALGLRDPPRDPGTIAVTVPPPNAVEAKLEELERRAEQADRFNSRLMIPLTILVGLLAGGGVIGLLTSIRYERRQAQLHDLAVSGERSSQARAEQSHMTFLASSQETVNLVNETLALAKQASEREAEATEQRAREGLLELDVQIEKLLDQADVTRDFKEVVSDSTLRHGLVDLAHRLAGIEGFLHLHRMKLTPRCFFVKGFDRHLNSAPTAAIENFRQAETPENRELSALALFWAGYEANNLGNFKKAIEYFRRAQSYVDESHPTFHDLARMQIQSRFFATIGQASPSKGAARRRSVSGIETELRDLIKKLETKGQDFTTELGLCHETLADVLVWAGRLSPIDRDTGEALVDDERKCIEDAKGQYDQGGERLWSRFGALQTRWALGDDDVKQHDYVVVHDSLVAEAHAHREQRTIVLRHAALLIVETSHQEPDEVLSRTHRDLRNVLGHMDHHITLFSPWQKRNVEHEVFDAELREYFAPVVERRKKGDET